MIGLFAYYLASPFNILLICFPKVHIAEAVLMITLLKVGAMGLTAYIYLHKHYQKSNIMFVIFSSCYALSAYVVLNTSNIMWLDGVIWLPMILLGIEQMVEYGKKGLYILSLTIAIYANYYIGYMLCIASMIYFLYWCIGIKGKSCYGKIGKRIKTFMMSSLAVGGLCAFLLIPTYLALQTGKAEFHLGESPLALDVSLVQILSKLYMGSYDDSQFTNGYPTIYVGTVATLLMIGFFINRQIERREKLAMLSVMIIYMVSFMNHSLNLVWHGFDHPICFEYRNAFIFAFYIIIMAARCYEEREGLGIKQYLSILGVMLLISIWVVMAHYSFISYKKMLVTLVLFVVYMGLIYAQTYIKKGRRLWTIISGLLIYGELLGSAHLILNQFSYYPRKAFVNEINELEPTISELTGSGELFRMETFDQGVDTLPMLMGYYGISHSSSTLEQSSMRLLSDLGLCNQEKVYQYYGSGGTLVTDMLLGMRYYVYGGDAAQINAKEATWDGGKIYFRREVYKDRYLYENPFALPIAYLADERVQENTLQGRNIFEVQNNLLKGLGGDKKANYYKPIRPESMVLENIRRIYKADEVIYEKIDAKKPATINFILKAEQKAPIYMYSTSHLSASNRNHAVTLSINNKEGGFYNYSIMHHIQSLGNYQAGEMVNVTLTLQDKQFSMQNLDFYFLDMDAFEALWKDLHKGVMQIDTWQDGVIEGEVIAKSHQVLCTSILYDEGWKVTLDGQSIAPIRIANELIGVPLKEGTHQIRFEYHVPGLKLGCGISIVTLLLLIIAYYWQIRRKEVV